LSFRASRMTTSPNDCRELASLMCRAQDGERVAYRALLTEIVPLLRNWLRRRHPYLSDPEDVVQEILLAVHAMRATYDGNRPLLPWLRQIAHNRSIDARRRQGRRSSREVPVADYPETSSEAQTYMAEEGYGDPEALRKVVNELPTGQRTANELVKFREM